METQTWNENRIDTPRLDLPKPVTEDRRRQVLLIDDDEDYYLIIRDLLEDQNAADYRLRWAQDYNEALSVLADQPVAAVLIDYRLGVDNGVDVTRQLTTSGLKAPVIILTGHGSYTLDLEAMQAGAVDYLVKSELTGPLLERTLRYAIERKGIESELERRVQERTLDLERAVDVLRAEISERVRAQQKIAYQANLLANVSDAIIATDENFNLTSWNHAAETIYGWTAAEVLGRPIGEVLKTEFVGLDASEAMRELVKTGEYNAVVIQYHKSGRPIYIEGKTMAFKNEAGWLTGFVSVFRNITERSLTEEANRKMAAELAAVQRRLIENVEAERLFISQELHDGPIQMLNAMVYKIAELITAMEAEQERAQLGELRKYAQELIEELREICNNLRPPALAPFGLEKAIRSHAEKFVEENPQIELNLQLQADGLELPERVRFALYRIYQQALANIVKHAQASEVDVLFWLDQTGAHLTIQDNGVGFSVPDRLLALARENHLGLVGAAERAAAVGGRLQVRSQVGEGTVIEVVTPF